jgi:hypothetical protein
MNASAVQSPLLCKYASCSQHVEAMASTSRKRSAVVCDDEVKECLLGSESEEILSDLEFDSENELDDCALLDVVVDDNNDEDNDIIQDFVWEDMNSYKRQRENFTGKYLKVLQKRLQKLWMFSSCFSTVN